MDNNDAHWLAVIGRSIAYLVLHNTDVGKTGSMLEKAQLLESLGVARADLAKMLGTTVDSLGAQLRQKRQRAGARSGRPRGKK